MVRVGRWVKQESGKTLRNISRSLMGSQASCEFARRACEQSEWAIEKLYTMACRGATLSSADELGVFSPQAEGEKGTRWGTC